MGISLSAVLAAERVRVGWTTREPCEWSFDTNAIAHACDALGVIGDVEVGCAEYARGRWAGMYSHERGVHRVRVGRRLSVDEASRVLWHELTHAAQESRGEVADTCRVRREQGHAAYMAHPHEVEARENEERAFAHPLTF